MFNFKLQNARKPKGYHGEKTLERMNKSHAPLVEWGISHLNLESNIKILDIGCGGGATINKLLKTFPESTVDGIDFSRKSVQMSKAFNADYLETRCSIIRGDATSLPYQDNSYSLVTAVETVYFWPSPKKAFSEVYRILNPSGTFMILCELSNPDDTTWTSKIKHMTIYSAEQLKALLKNVGFSEITIDYGEGENICVIARK